jgi:hypothetical protein
VDLTAVDRTTVDLTTAVNHFNHTASTGSVKSDTATSSESPGGSAQTPAAPAPADQQAASKPVFKMKRSGDAIYSVTPVSYPPGPTAIKPTVVTLTPDVDSESESEPEPEPEPPKIISDLSLPNPQSTPQNLTLPSPEIEVDLSRSAKASGKAGNGKGYKYSEERRRRISEQVRRMSLPFYFVYL